jgi:hypothetical protein
MEEAAHGLQVCPSYTRRQAVSDVLVVEPQDGRHGTVACEHHQGDEVTITLFGRTLTLTLGHTPFDYRGWRCVKTLGGWQAHQQYTTLNAFTSDKRVIRQRIDAEIQRQSEPKMPLPQHYRMLAQSKETK